MNGRADVGESSLGPWRWLKIAGSRREVFAALGRAGGAEIREWMGTSTDLPELERFRGSGRLTDLVDRTARQCPDQMVELAGLAEGAGVNHEDLLLVNLRGDLTNLGEGCSDVAVARGATRLVAHNEDGAPELEGLCSFVTLHIDGSVPVTSVWYPGFLPGMTCWLNGAGVACGVDHIPVAPPGTGAGRHFVARRLQESRSIEEMRGIAANSVVAGGYSYTAGRSKEDVVVNLELGPGGLHVEEVSGIHAHTNHFIYLRDPQDPDRRSRDRLSVLRRLPETTGAAELLGTLTSADGGVKRDATDGDPLMTLCSIVFDLGAENVSVVVRGDSTVHEMGFKRFLGLDR